MLKKTHKRYVEQYNSQFVASISDQGRSQTNPCVSEHDEETQVPPVLAAHRGEPSLDVAGSFAAQLEYTPAEP